MKVNVWWITAHCAEGYTLNTLYYSENLNRSVEHSNMVRMDVSELRQEGCSIESSHYGFFEYSKLREIAKNTEVNGRLFCVD